jgi:hypothetical protein
MCVCVCVCVHVCFRAHLWTWTWARELACSLVGSGLDVALDGGIGDEVGGITVAVANLVPHTKVLTVVVEEEAVVCVVVHGAVHDGPLVVRNAVVDGHRPQVHADVEREQRPVVNGQNEREHQVGCALRPAVQRTERMTAERGYHLEEWKNMWKNKENSRMMMMTMMMMCVSV